MFTTQHCAPVLENIKETGDMSALTACANKALESLLPHLSSLRRDSGSAALVVY